MIVRIMHHNTQGLRNDAIILKEILNEMHQVNVFVYEEIHLVRNDNIENLSHVDIQIFLEHIYNYALKFSRHNIFIPNIEWLNKKDYDTIISNKSIEILAKTVTCLNQMNNFNIKNKVIYTSWTSKDMYDENVQQEKSFLHVKGISKYKNSQLLLDVWLKNPQWPLLNIINYGIENTNGYLRLDKPIKIAENIILYQYKVDENTLKYLMNVCKYHICPSYSEGWGHYIVEGLSCNKIVITTNLPPMNEHIKSSECLIPIKQENVVQINMGHGATLEEKHLVETINNVLKKDFIHNTRNYYMNNKEFFIKKIQEYFNTLTLLIT